MFFPDYSFTPDEALHAYIARSISSGCLITTMYYHPAISYLYPLAFSFLLFGASELTARSLSIIIGILGIIVLYSTVKQLYNKRIALFSALILALTPIHIFLSTRAMMDILTNLLFITAFYFLVRFQKTHNKNYIYYIAIVFGIGINNKFNIILLLPLLIFYLILFRPKVKPKNILIATVLVLIISLPTLASTIAVSAIGYSPSITTYIETANFGQAVIENMLFYLNSFVVMNGLFSVLFAVAFVFSFITKPFDRSKRKWTRFLLMWIIFVFVFFSLAPGIRFERYMFLTIPPLTILSGLLLNRLYNKNILITFILFLLAAASILHLPFQTNNYNWDKVGQYLNKNTNPGDLIYTDQGWLINFYADRYATSYINYNQLNNPPSNLKYIVIKSDEFTKPRTAQYALYINNTFPLEKRITDFFIFSINGSEEPFIPKPFCINTYLQIAEKCNWNIRCISQEIAKRYEPSSPISATIIS
jgi:4-amino-4-deoxy-L-arabinose transferase-like glycosyltransferase